MSESYVGTLPILGQLGTLFLWSMLFNILLVGAVVFLAHRLSAMSARVQELENAAHDADAGADDPSAAKSNSD